ncbi:hypothetical protein [Bradyrhizobium vignae]|uniref:Uncharacterized protein n=1 Tax=Bradyrhizobium vignae TaxID=1549949 RepID=A0A2U3Q9T2_9BRAD|nr:hypothetical protein [Bradyrhizobium vignae]SPP98137.1 protein of unknown function [Bradyrhizobium vignae]
MAEFVFETNSTSLPPNTSSLRSLARENEIDAAGVLVDVGKNRGAIRIDLDYRPAATQVAVVNASKSLRIESVS